MVSAVVLTLGREEFIHRVTEEDITLFTAEYKGSQEEAVDLKKAFTQCKGDLTKVFNTVMCSNPLEDEDRFRAMIDEWISKQVGTACSWHDLSDTQFILLLIGRCLHHHGRMPAYPVAQSLTPLSCRRWRPLPRTWANRRRSERRARRKP
jgi:hypothetical protein